METLQASEFKAKCLALMDNVARTGLPLLITKNGKPVAELHPHKLPRAKTLFGIDKDCIEILGDIVSPVEAQWEALK